jgi:hypothetical protein
MQALRAEQEHHARSHDHRAPFSPSQDDIKQACAQNRSRKGGKEDRRNEGVAIRPLGGEPHQSSDLAGRSGQQQNGITATQLAR